MDAIRLDGKVAIVTGGAGGIGEATVMLLQRRGARVVIADIALDRAQALATTLDDVGAVHVDLAEEHSIAKMIDTVVAQFGRLDILHNNAALIDDAVAKLDTDVEEMSTVIWDRTYRINARGTMLVCRQALPHLRRTRGVIVNTVSNLALQGHMIQAAYSSSKAAIIQLTRAIAASHGVHGVRCNAVAPGMTLTPALVAAFPAVLREAVEAETLRDRLGAPEDIAQVVAFLASDAARNITGQVLVADGGGASHVPGIAAFRKFFAGL